MDRIWVYPTELPRSVDVLTSEKNALYALGFLARATFGSSTCVHGLPCAATSPASLNITIGEGSIYALEDADATSYGGLGVDTNSIVKQGLLTSPATLSITPPSTSGYSQIFLIEAAYTDQDSGATVLPYYNAANPQQPYSGPNNSGTAQYTLRQGICTISLKAGAAAPTGSQVAPSVDSGYVALYYITVVNGQSTITSANISQVPTAPFIPLNLNEVPAAIQAQAGNYAVDTGSANAVAISLPVSYTPSTLGTGTPLRVKKGASANTGTVTCAVNGGSPITVQWADGTPLSAGDWPAGAVAQLIYDGTVFNLASPPGPTVFARLVSGLTHYGTDTGTANAALVAAVVPAITSVTTGMLFEITKGSAGNTGAMTLQVDASGGNVTATLEWQSGTALTSGQWPANTVGLVEYDGTLFRLLSVSSQPQGTYYGAATGTNTLTTTLSPAISSLNDGMLIAVTPSVANTGAVTLACNGLSAASVTHEDGSALTAGELQPNQPVLLIALGGALLLLNRNVWPNSLTTNGYQKLGSGLILQWGKVDWGANEAEGLYGPYTFPITFPNALFNISLTTITPETTGSVSAGDDFCQISESNLPTTSQFYVWNNLISSGTNAARGFYWHAIGY